MGRGEGRNSRDSWGEMGTHEQGMRGGKRWMIGRMGPDREFRMGGGGRRKIVAREGAAIGKENWMNREVAVGGREEVQSEGKEESRNRGEGKEVSATVMRNREGGRWRGFARNGSGRRRTWGMAGDGGSLVVERGGDDGEGMRSWRRGWQHIGPEAAAAAAA